MLEITNPNVILVCQGTIVDDFFKLPIMHTNKVRGVIIFCKKVENYINFEVDQPLVHEVTSTKKGIIKAIASLIKSLDYTEKTKKQIG